MSIIYTNEEGLVINKQQALLLPSYYINTYENNNRKKIEYTGFGENNTGRTIQYYLSPAENKNQILETYSDGKTGVSIYLNATSQNGFTLWNSEGYGLGKILKRKEVVVYNSKDWEVMHCQIDINTGEIIGRGEKWYYGNQFPNQFDDLLLIFHYGTDSQLKEVQDFNYTYGLEMGSVQLDYFLSYMHSIQQDFPWDQHPYFHMLTPYLPESINL